MKWSTRGFCIGASAALCLGLSTLFPRDDFWIGAALGIIFPWMGAALGALVDSAALRR